MELLLWGRGTDVVPDSRMAGRSIASLRRPETDVQDPRLPRRSGNRKLSAGIDLQCLPLHADNTILGMWISVRPYGTRPGRESERGRKIELKIDLHSIYWWFWAVTLVGIIAGLSGRLEGFYGVIAVSLIQTIYFTIERGFVAFPTQVRLVYFARTVIAFFDPTRIFFWMLLVGTVMVTLFDRCIIARVLVKMPWNKGVSLT